MPPINLSSGFPAPSLNPIKQLNQATNTVFSTPDIWHDGMIYGPDAGYDPLRRNIARWLARFYYGGDKTQIDAERICITGGASQNLACLLQVFTDPVFTRNMFIVEPGYFLSFRVFEDAGFHGRLRGVPEDEEGIDLAFLEEMLKRDEEAHLGNEDIKVRWCLGFAGHITDAASSRSNHQDHIGSCTAMSSTASRHFLTLPAR